MAKKLLYVTAAFMLVSVFAANVTAEDEVTELKKMLKEQSLMLKKLENRLNQIESKQENQEQAVEAKICKKMEEKYACSSKKDSIEWASNLNFYGDFRYRHETIDKEGSDVRDRHRIRFRLGMDAKINDDWDFGLRLVTGSGDPVSTNQTLDGSFSTKDFLIDRAFVTWTPPCMGGDGELMLGKFGVPFYKPGKTELFWDGDLSVEGVAATYNFGLSEDTTGWLTGAALWVEEVSDGADVALFGGQAGLKIDMDDVSSLKFGGGFYGYSNVMGADLYDDGTFGNTAMGGDANALMYGYELVEVFAEYDTKIDETPVKVYFDYANNVASGVSEDTGWLIGATYNKAKKPGTWQISYNYRDVEADAVLGVLTDSDFIGGGTGGRGHEFGFKYAIAKNFYGGVSYFMNEIEGGSSDTDYDRLQLDLVYKF